MGAFDDMPIEGSFGFICLGHVSKRGVPATSRIWGFTVALISCVWAHLLTELIGERTGASVGSL